MNLENANRVERILTLFVGLVVVLGPISSGWSAFHGELTASPFQRVLALVGVAAAGALLCFQLVLRKLGSRVTLWSTLLFVSISLGQVASSGGRGLGLGLWIVAALTALLSMVIMLSWLRSVGTHEPE